MELACYWLYVLDLCTCGYVSVITRGSIEITAGYPVTSTILGTSLGVKIEYEAVLKVVPMSKAMTSSGFSSLKGGRVCRDSMMDDKASR